MSASDFRLLFAGTPTFAAFALERILASDFAVAAVLTQPDRPAGRGMKLAASPVKEIALAHGLPVLQPASLKKVEAQAQVQAFAADIVVVAAYGLIVPQAILDIPRRGCINIHASRLPRGRGAAPIQRALLAGDTVTGISIMQMDAGLDTGPVLRQAAMPIAADETAGTLHDKLALLGAEEVVTVLRQMREGLKPSPVGQPTDGITYAHKIGAGEAHINWREPAPVIDRQIRAFNPHPGAQTHLAGVAIKIWRAEPVNVAGPPATVVEAANSGIVIACGEGSLRVLELQRAGGKRLASAAFLAGLRLRAGERFATEFDPAS